MTIAARMTFTAATALLAGAVAAPAHADFTPQAVSGPTIVRGADGVERTLMCPPEEHVLSGGFTVSAPAGRKLASTPGDVLTSRSDPDATGWTVAIRKPLRPVARGSFDPADLTLQVVCTEGEVTPGG